MYANINTEVPMLQCRNWPCMSFVVLIVEAFHVLSPVVERKDKIYDVTVVNVWYITYAIFTICILIKSYNVAYVFLVWAYIRPVCCTLCVVSMKTQPWYAIPKCVIYCPQDLTNDTIIFVFVVVSSNIVFYRLQISVGLLELIGIWFPCIYTDCNLHAIFMRKWLSKKQ
jgi:hypothetical protein